MLKLILMKNFIKISLLNSFSLFLVASIYPGLIIPNSLIDLLWAGIIFTLINHLVKPLIKLFLLPINLITMGLFRWLANVFILVILVRISSKITLIAFTSSTLSYSGFVVPSIKFNLIYSFILASFLLSITFNLLKFFLTKD